MVSRIEPLPAAPVKLWRGLDSHSPLWFLALVSVTLFWSFAVLKPSIANLEDTRDSICGGEQNWVYSIGSVQQAEWAFATPIEKSGRKGRRGRSIVSDSHASRPWKPEWSFESDAKLDRRFDAVLQGAGDLENCTCRDGLTQIIPVPLCCMAEQIRVPEKDGGIFAVASVATESLEQGLNVWNPFCLDVLDMSSDWPARDLMAEILDGLLRAESPCDCPLVDGKLCFNSTCGVNASCEVLEPYCHGGSILSVTTRTFCPQRCGCAVPRSPLVESHPEEGCGNYCPKRPEYLYALTQLPCVDVAPNDAEFVAFLNNVETASLTWPYNWASGLNREMLGIIRHEGCPFVSHLATETGIDLCIEGGSSFPLKPFSYFCPVSCGCRGGAHPDPHCPTQCPAEGAIRPNVNAAALGPFAKGYTRAVLASYYFPNGHESWTPPYYKDYGTGEVHLWGRNFLEQHP